MKKTLTVLAITGLAVAAFAQGTVSWTGSAGTFIAETNASVYSTFGTLPGSSTGAGTIGTTFGSGTTLYYYELLVSSTAVSVPTTASALSSWSDTSLSAQNGAGSNGRISQNNATTDNTANNWPAGTTENVIVVGWSANLGTSWSTVLGELQNWSTEGIANSYFGVSSLGTLISGTANPGVSVFGTNPGQINNGTGNPMQMDLVGTVPEPGTLALAAIGGASLLMFRRKK
jgi:hypothetical protein